MPSKLDDYLKNNSLEKKEQLKELGNVLNKEGVKKNETSTPNAPLKTSEKVDMSQPNLDQKTVEKIESIQNSTGNNYLENKNDSLSKYEILKARHDDTSQAIEAVDKVKETIESKYPAGAGGSEGSSNSQDKEIEIER